jgi:spoIIIJ-associated protein
MTAADQTFRGVSLDEALDTACRELDVRLGELSYEIVTESADEVVIDARVDSQAVVGLFLSEVFRAGELDLSVQLDAPSGVLEGELSGDDAWILTKGNGRGLDALQYLCNRVLRRKSQDREPIHLDVGGYKERRSDQLQDEAEKAADEAVRTRRPVTLGPLTPAARREIHLALADDPGVETVSDGNGFLKKVVVRPLRRG